MEDLPDIEIDQEGGADKSKRKMSKGRFPILFDREIKFGNYKCVSLIPELDEILSGNDSMFANYSIKGGESKMILCLGYFREITNDYVIAGKAPLITSACVSYGELKYPKKWDISKINEFYIPLEAYIRIKASASKSLMEKLEYKSKSRSTTPRRRRRTKTKHANNGEEIVDESADKGKEKGEIEEDAKEEAKEEAIEEVVDDTKVARKRVRPRRKSDSLK